MGLVLWLFVETSAGILREDMTFIMRQNKNIIRIALATAFLLLLPLVAMQITDDVVWSLADFVTAGGLLFGTGLTYVLVAGKGGTLVYRAAVGVALGTALFLVWANLAVGIIGNEGNPANLAYFGVLAVGFIGAFDRAPQAAGDGARAVRYGDRSGLGRRGGADRRDAPIAGKLRARDPGRQRILRRAVGRIGSVVPARGALTLVILRATTPLPPSEFKGAGGRCLRRTSGGGNDGTGSDIIPPPC